MREREEESRFFGSSIRWSLFFDAISFDLYFLCYPLFGLRFYTSGCIWKRACHEAKKIQCREA